MREIFVLLIHLIVTLIRLERPGGLRGIVAESVLVRHQLLILNRGRRRAPNRKYRMLFSPLRRRQRPGPKGPQKELVGSVVEMKRRNPNWGCPRIAQQIALAFGVAIDKDVVRRILSVHYRPESDSGGPSRPTFLGNAKDSLWSCDLFRCESALLKSYGVLVVMDQFTRRIIGFGVHAGPVDGLALCRMFLQAIGNQGLPTRLSSDHDPLYRFHQWQANLRVLGVAEIKTVPRVPISHPFVERLIGTVRREHLDRLLFWSAADLAPKLLEFREYYNRHRTHSGLEGHLPRADLHTAPIDLYSYRWRSHCRWLFQTPIAA
jgi:transposase InsO family protein